MPDFRVAHTMAVLIYLTIAFVTLHGNLCFAWRFMGVLWTDLFQFVLKMAIVFRWPGTEFTRLAGCRNFSRRLRRRAAAGPEPATSPLSYPIFPRVCQRSIVDVAGDYFCGAFDGAVGAFWYPGAEPGGGGYIAQRIFSAKTKGTDVVGAVVQPGALRAAALALDFDGARGVVLYPGLAQPNAGNMLVATRQTPHALLGILLADSWQRSCPPSQRN